jgi:5-methylthioribose kinase
MLLIIVVSLTCTEASNRQTKSTFSIAFFKSKRQFKEKEPGNKMQLNRNNISDIEAYLRSHSLLGSSETVLSVEKPGEGNMNYVVRAVLPGRSIIIKQARPYVEKYPTIAAPEERVIIEGKFYEQVTGNSRLSTMMPAIIKIDEQNHILILEDLGEANDFTFLYKREVQLSKEEATSLATFISELHNTYKASGPNELMANRKLRALNHEHIFVYPLMSDNGLNLDTIQNGLQELSMKYKTKEQLKDKARQLGAVYLQDGVTLLHGDYYPGSWLQTQGSVKIIDAEFSFYGPAEFDLGVMIAHLKMAKQDERMLEAVNASYNRPLNFDQQLLNEFIGIEIIRRIIGLAQLPLLLTLNEKEALLQDALKLLGIE